MAIPTLLFFILPFLALYFLLTLICHKPIKIPIKGRHVFISGGSSGIGLSIAHQAASQGARVSILARNLKNLEEARESIRKSCGVEVGIYSADVRDFEAVERAVGEAGPIDVLICNHGVFIARELELEEVETLKFTIDVNLGGTFNLVKAALPGMKMNRSGRGPGSIALMSSQVGQTALYGYTAYSATKFGLRGLAESLQQELVSDDIHVSLILPPNTDTPGLVEDKKRRPELTTVISSFSSAMTADEVAKKSLDGIKAGKFLVSCNLMGLFLSLGSGDMSPQRSPIMAFFEVLTAGLCRLVSLCFVCYFKLTIAAWNDRRKSKKN